MEVYSTALLILIITQNNTTTRIDIVYSTSFTFTSNGMINQTEWTAMWNTYSLKHFTIVFYCNDTAGNIGSANLIMLNPSLLIAVWIPPSSDDDNGKEKEKGFDIIKFLISEAYKKKNFLIFHNIFYFKPLKQEILY